MSISWARGRLFARLVPALAAALMPAFARAGAADAPPPLERLAHAGRAARATLSEPSSIEPFLDGFAAAHMADHYPPGMMVAVATKDEVFVKAYGAANLETGERVTTATLFRIASISKTFIWTAVMMLADEGRLDLDADVNSYLKNVKVRAKYGDPVTLNDLMAHRAGFEESLGVFFQGGTGRTMSQALEKTRPARVAPPGARTSYSNWGADLAAEIVADVSGLPFDAFVRQRILEPVGMVSTALHDPASIAGAPLNAQDLDRRLAAPHKLDGGAPVVMAHDSIDPLYPSGAAALDAHDAARFLQFFLNDGVARGKRLLSPQAFTTMRLRAFPDRTGAPDLAHGFMETEIAGQRTFGHGGTLAGFVSDMTIVPSLGLGVFVAVNGAERPRLPDLVSRAIVEQFAGSAETWPTRWAVAADAKMIAAAKSVAGTYAGNRRVETKFERIAALGSEIKIAAKEDGSLVVSAGGTEKRYYPLAEDLWSDRARDRLFAYRGKDGAVKMISLAMGTDSAERAGFLDSSNGFYAAVGAVGALSLLAFVAAWRRQGRAVATTPIGRRLALGHAASALLWLFFIGVFAFAMIDLSGKSLPELQAEGWPPPPIFALQIAAHAAALSAFLIAVGSAPVFLRSGWSLWRKAHYLLFAAAGIFAVFELWAWRLIFSATSG